MTPVSDSPSTSPCESFGRPSAAPPLEVETHTPPRGRPPQNYVWDAEFGYVHVGTGQPFNRDAHKAVLRARKTAIERRRYWDPAKSVRARRLLRSYTGCARQRPSTLVDELYVQMTSEKNPSGNK